MMNERQNVVNILNELKIFLTRTGKPIPMDVLPIVKAFMGFINFILFCDCKYVEYWCLDLNFGQNTTETEMGYELRGLDTIEKFVDFMYEKRASNATKINLEIFQHHA